MHPLIVFVIVSVYNPALVTIAFKLVDEPEMLPLVVVHCAL